MLSKNELKYIQSLCQKRQRQAEGLFVAEGAKLVGEMLNDGFPVRKIYAVEEWVRSNNTAKDVTVVTPAELERISIQQTPNQVIAIAEQQDPGPLPDLKGTLTLALDSIRDPGNLGTIIRIADWFGISNIIASNDTVELYNPKVIQSTMGSFLRVSTWYTQLEELLATAGVPVFGALLKGRSVYDVRKKNEGILLIGNESGGIDTALQRYITDPVTIPRIGGAESLNAAVATGIILSHLLT